MTKKIQSILKSYHEKNRFIKIKKIDTLLSTNDVINSNNCYISICKTKNKNASKILK